MSAQNEMLQAALAYAARGFAVLPLRGKVPFLPGGYKAGTKNPDQIRAIWERHPDSNLGIATGAISGIVVMDLDSAEAEGELRILCGGYVPETLTHNTGRGKHLVFQCPPVAIQSRVGVRPKLDVRAEGGLIAAPPSVHPERGTVYTVVDAEAPIAPLPPMLLLALTEKPGAARTTPAPMLEEGLIVREGGRHDFLVREAGRLRGHAGLSIHAVRVALHAINTVHCDPPCPDAEVETLAASTASWARGDTVVQELNEHFALVQVGDKVRILQEQAKKAFTLLTPHEFRYLLCNQFITDGKGKRRPVADYWLTSPDHRSFDGIVFEPGPPFTPNHFNVFAGWSVEPREGSCQLFLDHIRDNVCRGDEGLTRWVLGWFAQLFQQPREKPGTALVLRGRQGTGKSIVGDIVGHQLDPHHATVASNEHITGRFNSHQERCLLLQGEEAFLARDKSAESVLKDLVTGTTQFIERKGVDPVQVPNYKRLLVTSNYDWVVPAGAEERRFAVLDVGDGRMQDRVYFGAIMHEMKEKGGYEALLHFLQHFDLSSVDVTKVPKTAALDEQKIHSLSPEARWWLDILMDGRLPGDARAEGLCLTRHLYAHYLEYMKGLGAYTRLSKTQLGLLLKKWVPEKKKPRVKAGEDRSYWHQFPPLNVCRKAFEKRFGWSSKWSDAPATWKAFPIDDSDGGL